MATNTDNLIDSLASELQEVKCACHPLKTALPWFIFAIIYLAFAIAVLGIRPDFSDRLLDSSYLFELVLVMLMSISATFSSLWLCFPDMRGQRWMLAVPISLFAILMIWLGLRTTMHLDHAPHVYWSGCINEALIFGLLPALTLALLAARGKTTQPQMMSFMNTIAIGGLGYLGLRITCSMEDMGHIMIYHFAPYIFIGFAIAAAGIKIYRW